MLTEINQITLTIVSLTTIRSIVDFQQYNPSLFSYEVVMVITEDRKLSTDNSQQSQVRALTIS